MLKIPFFELQSQYKEIRIEIDREIKDVLDSQFFILGSKLESFESDFEKYIGTKYAVGVGNGTDALFLALKALDIGPGDEVITVANSFIASTLVIEHTGARTTLVDCDPETHQIRIEDLNKVLTKRTKAIIPVHLYGAPCDIKAVMKFAKKNNLYVIEDCAQAHGATVEDKKVGTFGDMGTFSFYPAKNLGAYGDGGIVVTNKAKFARKLKRLRNYGQFKKYHYDEVGYNSRLDELQASVLSVKLKHLDKWNKKRIKIANQYIKAFVNLKTQKLIKNSESVYHLFVVEVSNRKKFIKYMNDKKISTLIHYPVPIHLQPSLKYLGYKLGDFPNSERISKQIISLPLYPELTNQQIDYIVDSVNKYTNT